jgi:hypothetical protein
LTTKHQNVLRQAASETRDWAATQHDSLAAAAKAYCAGSHGDVVLATASQLAALKAATEPVSAELKKDEFTRRAIERIAQLKKQVPEQPVSACISASPGMGTSGPASDATLAASTDDQRAIDGTWRFEVALDPNADRPDAKRQATLNNGTWTLEFNNGRRLVIEPSGNRVTGSYVLDGDRIRIVDDDGVKGEYVFHRDGNTMRWMPAPGWLDPVQEELEIAANVNPMLRIGDPTIQPGNQSVSP